MKNRKNDSPKCGTQEGEETLVHQELTNCEIDYDQYHCYDCSQSLCLCVTGAVGGVSVVNRGEQRGGVCLNLLWCPP